MDPVVCSEFNVTVDADQVLRMMGVPKRGGDRRDNAPGQALELYPALHEEALRLVHPKAIYTICPVSDIRYHPVFKSASHMGFAVCTIGPALENESADSGRRGESLRALVLDAIGSEAVESVVEQTADRIRALANEMGLDAGRRFSPGYGKWRLEEQRVLFGIVDGSAIGVRLNDACIMVPRKSVSFAIRIGSEPDAAV